jgi:hypothetical protein
VAETLDSTPTNRQYEGEQMKRPKQTALAPSAEAEAQIRDKKTQVDYQTKEFTVELLVHKYENGLADDENEIYIPQYQRAFVWSDERQSKFIESMILELPIPYIFIASLPKDIRSDEGRAEVVDGSQRLRTLNAFLDNKLTLKGLEKLSLLNGYKFCELELSRQRKIKRLPIRVIELSDKATEEIRRDIFERLNTGSDELRDMEKRKGIYTGAFYDFIKECAKSHDFREVCPISHAKERREEAEELVLRYFAYCDSYLTFKHDVRKFLDGFLKSHRENFPKERMAAEFQNMVSFAKANLPYGFKKNTESSSVARVRFEALACGITLAQRQNSGLKGAKGKIDAWINSEEFLTHVVSDASNSLPRLKGRIEFVRDRLLEG